MAAIEHDWFIREWLKASKMKQADLDRATEWGKRKTSHLVSGVQPFNRDTLSQAANALNIKVHELLMHPEDAMALRQLRKDALRVVQSSEALDRTGTEG